MKLYDLPRGAKIKVETFNKAGERIGEWITFHHTDGMYSYCTVDAMPDNNKDGSNVVHLSVVTPMKAVKKGRWVLHYEIDLEENTKRLKK